MVGIHNGAEFGQLDCHFMTNCCFRRVNFGGVEGGRGYCMGDDVLRTVIIVVNAMVHGGVFVGEVV